MPRIWKEIRELWSTCDFFQAGGSALCKGAAVAEKYQFMNSKRINFSMNWMANKLAVPCSGYFAWLHRQDNPGPWA